jgi:DNA helicase-2/ATP-dependent DNA helicase PcrA
VQEEDGLKYLEQVFDQIAEKLNIDYNKYQSLVDDYNSFFESSSQRIERLVKEGNESISTTANFKKVFKQKDGITISTMHGVKGLEFDTVIAFGILQDWVPHFSDPDGGNSAKKLLYVISSRARLNLHLIAERGRFKRTNPPQELICTYKLSEYNYTYTAI